VPLIAREHTLGALTFVSADSGRRYRSADLQFAQELAARPIAVQDFTSTFSEVRKQGVAKAATFSVAFAQSLQSQTTALKNSQASSSWAERRALRIIFSSVPDARASLFRYIALVTNQMVASP